MAAYFRSNRLRKSVIGVVEHIDVRPVQCCGPRLWSGTPILNPYLAGTATPQAGSVTPGYSNPTLNSW